MAKKIWQSTGLQAVQARDVHQDLSLQADVVIVGSGAGGAVMAYELAKSGKSVVILEAGPYIPSSDFQEKFVPALQTLYADHGGQINSDGDLVVLQGRCVGGSTVVNACVCFRTPDYILQDWQQAHGLHNLTPETLRPYFEKVEQRLSVHENEEAEINRNSALLREGARRLGVSWKPFRRNVRNCALTGHCLSGCATDRKQSMLVTYLPWALAEGAQLYADTTVNTVLMEGGRAVGVQAEIINPHQGNKIAAMTVRAKVVVLSAGAIQTPLILQRSGIANKSGQVGKNFACHPSLFVTARYPEEVFPWRGAMLGVHIDEWQHPSKGGFILEAGGAGPVELASVANPGLGKDYLKFMEELRYIAGLVTLIHDRNAGEIRWDGSQKNIDYRLTDADFNTMKAAIKAAAKVHFAAGATTVYVPTVAQREIRSAQEIDPVVDSIEDNQKQTFRMVSYHPQGTCRMGADPGKSVVGPNGETHDVPHLFIADASLFPTSIIVNPQMTVYALASYIADKLINEGQKYWES